MKASCNIDRNNVISFGEGSRSLVVIPGLSVQDMSAVSDALEQTFRRFTSSWTVYVIDRPSEVHEGLTNADLASYYVSVMQSLGIRDADIVGASQGAMIAQFIAAEHPEFVHALVLGSTLSRSNPTFEKVVGHWIELARNQKWYQLNKDFFSKLYTDSYQTEYETVLDSVASTMKPDDPVRFIRLATACLSGGYYEGLARIKCPILVMGGECDQVVTSQASYEIADATGCAIHIFKGFGHAVYDEISKQFYDRVQAFLESVYSA